MNDLLSEFSPQELMTVNIQFLGLKQQAWEFSRGARLYRNYCYADDSIAVKDSYTYSMINGDRDIDSYTRTLEWFNPDGSLIKNKDITPVLNIKNKKFLNREIRQGRIDYLVAAAEQLAPLAAFVPEPYATDFLKATDSINLILDQYEKEIVHYVDNNSREFEEIVLAESNPILVDILGLNVRPPDALFPSGLTIKQSIIHQLTGVVI